MEVKRFGARFPHLVLEGSRDLVYPIRILCVFGSLDRGGAETMCMNLYRHIDRDRIQFDFVTHSGSGGAFEEEIRSIGGSIYYCPKYKIYNDLYYRKWWEKHFKQHPEHRIIHGHYFSISSVYFSVAHQFDRITIGHSHCTSPVGDRGVRDFLFHYYCSKVEKHSDFCLACSKDAGKYLFKKKKFSVVNNAIETERFLFNKEVRKRVRDELGIAEKYVVGNVGRLVSPKNHPFIIRVFAELHRNNPDSVLMLVGDGPKRKEIEKLIEENGLRSSVVLMGTRGDVPDLLQAMDVFFFPSLFEGLGIVAIEAQASCLPVVASDIIPDEAVVTDQIRRISLAADIHEWVEALMVGHSRSNRQNMKECIIKAGYDIHSTALWMQEYYLNIMNMHT